MMAIVLKIGTQLLTRLQVGMGAGRRLAIFLELMVIACWYGRYTTNVLVSCSDWKDMVCCVVR